MNLDTIVMAGSEPWAPSPGVHDVDVWAMYEVPSLGTFKMPNGESVLFAAIFGTEDPYTLWVYVPLSNAEAAEFSEATFDSDDEMWARVEALFDGHRNIVFCDASGAELSRCRSEWSSKDGLYAATIRHLEAATRYYRDQAEAARASWEARLAESRVEQAEGQIRAAKELASR